MEYVKLLVSMEDTMVAAKPIFFCLPGSCLHTAMKNKDVCMRLGQKT